MPSTNNIILLFEIFFLSFLLCIDVISSFFFQYIMIVTFSSHLRLSCVESLTTVSYSILVLPFSRYLIIACSASLRFDT